MLILIISIHSGLPYTFSTAAPTTLHRIAGRAPGISRVRASSMRRSGRSRLTLWPRNWDKHLWRMSERIRMPRSQSQENTRRDEILTLEDGRLLPTRLIIIQIMTTLLNSSVPKEIRAPWPVRSMSASSSKVFFRFNRTLIRQLTAMQQSCVRLSQPSIFPNSLSHTKTPTWSIVLASK